MYFSFDEKYCVLFHWAGPVTASKEGSCKSVRATRIRFLPEVRILLRIKPLSWSKAGEFSSVLEMPEWLQCSVVFINAFRWCLFFMQHIRVPCFPPPKENYKRLLSLHIPNRCYAVATVATRFFFQFEGGFWSVTSCTIRTGTCFKRAGGRVRRWVKGA